MSDKALILNSGGLDSLISCAIMSQQGWELHSLYIDLGQLNGDKSKQFAKQIAKKYCVSHEEIKLGNQCFNRLCPETGNPNWLGLPMQAQVVHSIGGFYASFNGFEYVVSGQKDDAVTPDFHTTLTKLFASDRLMPGVIFLRPVSNLLHVQDVVNKGLELKLDIKEMKDTQSCNSNPSCGRCKKCKERKEAGLDE